MPLDPALLGTQIAAAMVANPACGAQPGPATEALGLAIATAVVAHFIANCHVVAPTIIAPAGGGPCGGVGSIS